MASRSKRRAVGSGAPRSTDAPVPRHEEDEDDEVEDQDEDDEDSDEEEDDDDEVVDQVSRARDPGLVCWEPKPCEGVRCSEWRLPGTRGSAGRNCGR